MGYLHNPTDIMENCIVGITSESVIQQKYD
jgi:hypothetical protein